MQLNLVDKPASLYPQTEHGFVKIERSTGDGKEHNNHIEEGVRGVPGQIKALLTPTKIAMPPKRLRAYLRDQHASRIRESAPGLFPGGTIPEELRKQLITLHQTAGKKNSRQLMEPGQRGRHHPSSTLLLFSHLLFSHLPLSHLALCVPRYGGLVTVLEKLERSYLIAQDAFNHHVPFVLGAPLVVPETDRVTVAISTENLLLNAYR